MSHQLYLVARTREPEVGVTYVALEVVASEERAHRLRLVEPREPLILPGVTLLIRSHLHREPHVRELVHGDRIQA